jgi:hypothetical protein
VSAFAPAERADAIAAAGDAARSMPDPQRGVSWALRCLRLSAERFLVLLSAQHLEMDGASVSFFVDDLRDAYRRIRAGEPPFVDQAPQYHEFVVWQSAYLAGPIERDRAFFTGLYTNSEGPTHLPGCADLDTTSSFPSARVTVTAETRLWKSLQRAASGAGVSPFAILCAAYCRLVAGIVGRDRVTVGTILSGRPNEETARIVGPFVAPFPISVSTLGRSARGLADECHRVVIAINDRCAYPPADLAAQVPPFAGLPMDTYFTDPFIMFNNYTRESRQIEPRAEVLECLAPLADPQLARLDAPTLAEIAGLFLIIDIWDEEPRFNFWYHQHRFSKDQTSAWARSYLALLRDMLAELCDPSAPQHATAIAW